MALKIVLAQLICGLAIGDPAVPCTGLTCEVDAMKVELLQTKTEVKAHRAAAELASKAEPASFQAESELMHTQLKKRQLMKFEDQAQALQEEDGPRPVYNMTWTQVSTQGYCADFSASAHDHAFLGQKSATSLSDCQDFCVSDAFGSVFRCEFASYQRTNGWCMVYWQCNDIQNNDEYDTYHYAPVVVAYYYYFEEGNQFGNLSGYEYYYHLVRGDDYYHFGNDCLDGSLSKKNQSGDNASDDCLDYSLSKKVNYFYEYYYDYDTRYAMR